MARYFRTEALVLGTRPYGESSQRLQLLTRREGLIWVTAQGIFSGKSLTREAANLFTKGTAGLSSGPGESFHRLTFFDMEDSCLSLADSWPLYYTAQFWKELLLRFQGNLEEIPEIFSLTCIALEQLKSLNDEARRIKENLPRLRVQYLHRILIISGFQPDLDHCQSCGKLLKTEDSLRFNSSAETVCAGCINESESVTVLPPGCRPYLTQSSQRELKEALAVSMSSEILHRIEAVLSRRLEVITGRPFKTPLQRHRMGELQ